MTERERFEEWLKTNGLEYVRAACWNAWQAAIDAQAQPPIDGFGGNLDSAFDAEPGETFAQWYPHRAPYESDELRAKSAFIAGWERAILANGLEQDAKRYRWLRDAPWSSEMQRMFALQANATFDAAIDAAMAQQESGK